MHIKQLARLVLNKAMDSTGHSNTLFQLHRRRLYTWTSTDGQHQNQIDYILCSQIGEALYSQQKQDQELTVAQIMNSLLPNSTYIEESRENR